MKSGAMAAILCGLAAGASAQPTITFLPVGYIISDMSADGTVGCGNLIGPYETFIWTEAAGPVLLGRATVPIIGTGAGSPDISYDGTIISATIIDDTLSFATPGVWSEGIWQAALPPTGPNGINLDSSLGSAWGLSGDGQTLTGFYWRNPGKAQPMTWTNEGGVVALPVDANRSARVNGANYDGSVVVGWEERADGAWQSTVWRNGVKTRLFETEAFAGAEQVTADGSTIVGQSINGATRKAAIWRWNGTSYDQELLPLLPGTAVGFGQAGALGVTDDGATVVGFNIYAFQPFSLGDGWIWTAETGMIEAEDYIASLGLSLPPNFDVSAFSGISADGSTIFGSGISTITGLDQSFIIRLTDPCDPDGCLADWDGTGGAPNSSDFLAYLNAWSVQDACADLAPAGGDGAWDSSDFLAFLNAYSMGC
ncbi:MAG: GC-type dockerin domain-anchored protein [Phycisphaerales bacterium]|jgi:uncharacterized membrane protein|nr:GC-type dockerin domain-anchored protein [Phycisphaerales bacterium]